MGASYLAYSKSEAHTLYHWGAAAVGLFAAYLICLFVFWPLYVWGVERRTRWIARLPGGPSIRLPFAGRRHRREGGFRIISAQYGRDDQPNDWLDVTAYVQALVVDGRLQMAVANETFGGQDPIQNLVKDLVIVYESGGKRLEHRSTEGFSVDLP